MTCPKGIYVPVVTPFREDQSIDFDAFKECIDFVVGSGLDGILIAGSTGEYHTMTVEEHKEVIKKGCEFVDGRVPVLWEYFDSRQQAAVLAAWESPQAGER